MLARNIWNWLQPAESGDLDELRRGTILEVGAVIFAVAWVLMVGAYGDARNLIVPLILMSCSLVSVWLRQINFRLALLWLIGALLAAIACAKWLLPYSTAQYYYPVVIVISSLLISSSHVFIVALVASLLVVSIALLHGSTWLAEQEVITPVMLNLLTASAAWIGSRQIHLSLAWMEKSYTHANELLEQLRDERGSLARAHKALEDAYGRIERMNYALIEARSEAENARLLKAEFAANTSHELRTPLNLIIGFSETMANAPETYQGAVWTPALRSDVEHIYRSSRHLASLIDDILDLSALDARRLGLEMQDAAIGDVIEQAVDLVRDLFRAKNLYINTEIATDLPCVRIDTTRVRQVLINLLTNASRFTHTGGVTVTAGLSKGQVQVSVKDTGIGIAPKDVPKVFEEFAQVDGSVARMHDGTGLGVPLSKRLIESHGGSMWLESQPGEGTIFYFTLPESVQTALGTHSPEKVANTTQANYHKPILVCESDPLLLRTIRRHLSSYDVIHFKCADDVSSLVERFQPMAVIVNTRELEQPDGQQWSNVPADLPVIRFGMTGSLKAAQALGVQDYIIKPVLRERLIGAINAVGHDLREVLIVDDDPEVVELIARMLQTAGGAFRPLKVFTGVDALARLHSEKVDLVLLDMFMPEMDGMAVLKEMKADPILAQVPVIVISAQHPDVARAEDRLEVQLTRASNPTTGETLNYLEALIAALPLRGLPIASPA
jgi:signal transduction histidine kinase/CheY-like chemotaxis protein